MSRFLRGEQGRGVMKTQPLQKTVTALPRICRALLLAALAAFMPAPRALAQGGSLTPPPGVPGPTMRSLQEIYDKTAAVETQGAATQTSVNALRDDARTPISSAPFTISNSGSYYLTGNLTVTTGDAINISANNVTLDLNGFTIRSTASPASGSGITSSGTRIGIRIMNGSIESTTSQSGGVFTPGGFVSGVRFEFSFNRNIVVSDVRVRGVATYGIRVGTADIPTMIVERCTVSVCGGVGVATGILSHTVRSCSAAECGSAGINAALVSDSFGECVNTGAGVGFGILAYSVTNSRGVAVGGRGMEANNASNCEGVSTSDTGLRGLNLHNCTGVSTSGTGIFALNNSNVSNCRGVSTSGTGIFCIGNATNSYGETTSAFSGLSVTGTASFCQGKRDGGTAIDATIAIGCTVSGTGTVSSAKKFLGTP